MANKKKTRLAQRTLEKDRLIAMAVLDLKDYGPANAAFTADRIGEALKAMQGAQAEERALLEAAAAAREAGMEAEDLFHEMILGVKRQVVAQYGDNSNEMASLGLKKKSERRYGRPRKNADE